jgi:hypothetical protein
MNSRIVVLLALFVSVLNLSVESAQAASSDLNYYCSSLGSDQPMTLANCQAFCPRHIDGHGRERLGQCIRLNAARRIGDNTLEEIEPLRMVELDSLESGATF